MAGRRTSLATLAAGAVEDVPGKGEPTLVRLPLASITPTPLNPRKDFGSREELVELGESMRRNQLGPVVVVSRASYLKLFPEHADEVGTVAYVIANGERRFRGATAAGLPAIEAVIREAIAENRKTFIDAVVTENVDRKNFDPIEEAHAVEVMVREFGTAREVAEHRGVTEGWVSQRRRLLRLCPDMQELVRRRVMPVEKARMLAKAVKDHGLDEEQQREWWATELGRPKAAKQTVSSPPAPTPAAPGQPVQSPQVFTAVKTEERSVESAEADAEDRESLPTREVFTAVKTQSQVPPSLASPSPGAQSERVAMPWTNPQRVLAILREHMAPEDLEMLLKLAQA